MEMLPGPVSGSRPRCFRAYPEGQPQPGHRAQLAGLGPTRGHCHAHKAAGPFLRVKTKWARQPPFLIWQVDSPKLARSFLDMHDQHVCDGGQPHRVKQHFAIPNSHLRRNMESFADGKDVSHLLRSKILSYQCCTLDDTWVEAVHRDLAGFRRKKHMAKMPYRFGSLRLGQNLDLCESLSATEPNTLEQLIWPWWRAIASLATPRIPLRSLWDCRWLSARRVYTKAYKLGQASLVDWASNLPPLTNASWETAETRASPQWAKRLQWDFMHTLVEFLGNQSVLSIQDQEDSRSTNPRTATTQRLFQVIMGGVVRREKQLKTAWSTGMGAMACPAMLQNLAILASRGHDTWDVYQHGHPDVEDLVRCAPWRSVRCDLSFWSLVPADTAGCVQLGQVTRKIGRNATISKARTSLGPQQRGGRLGRHPRCRARGWPRWPDSGS